MRGEWLLCPFDYFPLISHDGGKILVLMKEKLVICQMADSPKEWFSVYLSSKSFGCKMFNFLTFEDAVKYCESESERLYFDDDYDVDTDLIISHEKSNGYFSSVIFVNKKLKGKSIRV